MTRKDKDCWLMVGVVALCTIMTMKTISHVITGRIEIRAQEDSIQALENENVHLERLLMGHIIANRIMRRQEVAE